MVENNENSKQFVNPNLFISLEFKSPNATPNDRFATTNVGYTTPIKGHTISHYQKKLNDEFNHRNKMRKIILDQSFELGMHPERSPAKNPKPLFEQAEEYTTKELEENKERIEKQNFTI